MTDTLLHAILAIVIAPLAAVALMAWFAAYHDPHDYED